MDKNESNNSQYFNDKRFPIGFKGSFRKYLTAINGIEKISFKWWHGLSYVTELTTKIIRWICQENVLNQIIQRKIIAEYSLTQPTAVGRISQRWKHHTQKPK